MHHVPTQSAAMCQIGGVKTGRCRWHDGAHGEQAAAHARAGGGGSEQLSEDQPAVLTPSTQPPDLSRRERWRPERSRTSALRPKTSRHLQAGSIPATSTPPIPSDAVASGGIRLLTASTSLLRLPRETFDRGDVRRRPGRECRVIGQRFDHPDGGEADSDLGDQACLTVVRYAKATSGENAECRFVSSERGTPPRRGRVLVERGVGGTRQRGSAPRRP